MAVQKNEALQRKTTVVVSKKRKTTLPLSPTGTLANLLQPCMEPLCTRHDRRFGAILRCMLMMILIATAIFAAVCQLSDRDFSTVPDFFPLTLFCVVLAWISSAPQPIPTKRQLRRHAAAAAARRLERTPDMLPKQIAPMGDPSELLIVNVFASLTFGSPVSDLVAFVHEHGAGQHSTLSTSPSPPEILLGHVFATLTVGPYVHWTCLFLSLAVDFLEHLVCGARDLIWFWWRTHAK
jgi:hypothetical protein